MSFHLNKLMQMGSFYYGHGDFALGQGQNLFFVCMKNPASTNQNTEYIHRKTDEDGIENCFTNGDQKTSKRIINVSFTAIVTGKQLRWSFGIWSLWRFFSHVRLRGGSRVDLKPTEEVIYTSHSISVCHLSPSGSLRMNWKVLPGEGRVLSFHFNLYSFFLFHVM